MGTFATVAVCTVSAYASSYTIYDTAISLTANFTYTGLVQGGNCSFKISGDNATLQNSLVEIFNVTGGNQFSLEPFSCNLTTIQSCQTGYFRVADAPYQYITEEYENFIPGISSQLQNLQFEQNFTYVVLPPVPSQPPLFFIDSTNTTVRAITSQYSSEYGSPITGCVLSAGTGGSNYLGADLPSTLSTNGAGLPRTSSAQYGVGQSQALSFSLSSLNLNPSTSYDFVFVCYNANGKSPGSSVFQQFTSASLPTPSNPGNNGASSGKAVMGWGIATIGAAVMGAVLL